MDLLGAWPVATVFAAAILRVLEHAVLDDDRPLRTSGKLLVELLSTASQVLVVAGGVGFALLFGHRLGLIL